MRLRGDSESDRDVRRGVRHRTPPGQTGPFDTREPRVVSDDGSSLTTWRSSLVQELKDLHWVIRGSNEQHLLFEFLEQRV